MNSSRVLPQGEQAALFNGVFYNVPGLFSFSPLVYRYIDAVEAKFGYNVPIISMYGAPPTKWNGGRLLIQDADCFKDKKKIEREIIGAVMHNITPLITFSNLCISSEDLNDSIGNYILEIINEVSGGVIVASKIIESYIRERYPQIKVHASVIYTALNENRTSVYYEVLSKNYDKFVVHPDDLYRISLLEQIPKENSEILINERCGLNCKMRKQHYESISREQQSCVNGNFEYEYFLKKCSMIPESKQLYLRNDNISCTVDELESILKYGFRYVKLQGRIDNLYTIFFDIMRYTLDNTIVFPHLYPIFNYEIAHFIKEGK